MEHAFVVFSEHSERLWLHSPGDSFSIVPNKGYVWLDYFSIPQCVGKDENCPVTRQQQIDAIVSIPAYVEQCEVFLVLCTCPGASRPVREFVRCWPISRVFVAQGRPEGPSSQLLQYQYFPLPSPVV